MVAQLVWLASDEWSRWWDPVEVELLRDVRLADGTDTVKLAVTHPDEERLLLRADAGPVDGAPGTPVRVTVLDVPEEWDGERELRGSELRFGSEAVAYGRREDAPVEPADRRERTRKGWAW